MQSMKLPVCLSLLLTIAAACGSTTGSDPASGGPLVDESSGWIQVATVLPLVPLGTDHDTFAITPHELAVDATAIRVLFSVDTMIPPGQQSGSSFLTTDFKAITTERSATPPVVTQVMIADLTPNENTIKVRRPLFRAGTDSFETLLFYANSGDQYARVLVFDEAMLQITMQSLSLSTSGSTRLLPNGDILAGDVNASIVGELEHYHRASNTWTFINQSAGDGQWLIAYTPFVLASGGALAFRLYSAGDQAFLSIADFVGDAQYPAAPYAARFVESHAEYARSGVNGVMPVYASTSRVGAYVTEGQSVTVALVTKDNTTGAYTLSAYAWTEGELAFRTLYHAVPISTALGDLLMGARDRVGCQLDGTVYAIVTEHPTQHLVLASATGETRLGEVAVADGAAYAPILSQLRYAQGAYYAVVGLGLGTPTYQGQYLDVVKLVP